MSETPHPEQAPTPQAAPGKPRRWRRRLKWMGILSGILVVCLGSLLGTAEYYTAKPEFCGSCHIMGPYYASWSKDAHSGKGHADCVDCHYAPGEQHTFMAKFRGLSQLASYFSGRAGAGRPKARVNDASCLTSGCHGDGAFMNTELALGNVTFTHAKHLDPNGKITVTNVAKVAELRKRLFKDLGSERMTRLERVAEIIGPAQDRDAKLAAWAEAEAVGGHQADVLAYAEALHTELRLKHLEGLKCSSCHQFDSTLGGHFSANLTTCYTCHFMNQPFNANTGRCLSCHNPPAGVVAVHSAAMPAAGPATSSAPVVMMDHATILANNVNCASCHTDLIHGSGRVTLRDCQNCHDQDRFFRDFNRLTTDVVIEYHRVHAAGQRARCNDCHQVIEHKLLPLADPRDAGALLQPVRQNCQHCHPDHHREQVEMLLGQGGGAEHVPGIPSQMTGSRANCQACHVQPGADLKDDAVIRGTLESCRGCHSAEYEQLFAQWQQSLKARLQEAHDLLTTTQQRLAAAPRPQDAAGAEVARLVERARQNIHFVTTANGIHNKNYAMSLLDQAIADLEEAGRRRAR